jgi:DUF2075 family protein
MIIKKLIHEGVTYIDNTKEQLLSAGVPTSVIESAMAEANLSAIKDTRRLAYVDESDPLYMEWQYDQTSEKEKAWRDKVAEIKARYPLPSES